MGTGPSRFSSGGALKGAYAPPLPGVVLPPKIDPTVREYMATVPAGKKGGDKLVLDLNGESIAITIPKTTGGPNGQPRPIRPGDKFQFKWGPREKVIASTLPSLPGTTVVEAKPMIFANTSLAKRTNQTAMSKNVQHLLQDAQTMLLQQAVEMGCNAVLSINASVTTDSAGESGVYKIVIVTLVGTPCVVMQLDNLPVVQSEAYVVPDFAW